MIYHFAKDNAGERIFSKKFGNGTVFVYGIAETRLFFIVDLDLRTERAGMRARFFLMQKRRFCKMQIAKLCKIMQKITKKKQENLHMSKKSIIFATDFGREPKRTPKS